jgi:hypothetical protein
MADDEEKNPLNELYARIEANTVALQLLTTAIGVISPEAPKKMASSLRSMGEMHSSPDWPIALERLAKKLEQL